MQKNIINLIIHNKMQMASNITTSRHQGKK